MEGDVGSLASLDFASDVGTDGWLGFKLGVMVLRIRSVTSAGEGGLYGAPCPKRTPTRCFVAASVEQRPTLRPGTVL